MEGRNVIFNDALNAFYLRLYGDSRFYFHVTERAGLALADFRLDGRMFTEVTLPVLIFHDGTSRHNTHGEFVVTLRTCIRPAKQTKDLFIFYYYFFNMIFGGY